ncbi:galactosyltransferase-related protein [Thalassorhabdomicrobium marinisediminis]|uniref:galactosyltransferase-related protein n=1 Tax=Thalassorhabdomicrobium marinisediminis TaxID=2170577 RepID=UPI002492CB26|nr:galactosyltransferase-related protein [Thalassorhabdomicrobium marinisediminis]
MSIRVSTPRPKQQTVSALTLARGREAHLRNVILGLTRQTRQPDELVIGVMQDRLYDDLPDTDFPIRQIRIDGKELPLSRARNAVAEAAAGDCLVFLDVDCIPGPELVADYAGYAIPGHGLIMGEVNYLPAGAATEGWTYADFDAVAERHSDRQGPPAEGLKRCEDYRCFWSLNFAIHRADWDRTDGFDEAFTGYGGEDTDFGRQLDHLGVPIYWAKGAKVYHQHHPHCMPPIHHVPSILRNTEVFAAKWGHRTMEHWLTAFRIMGLIEEVDGTLRQIREPDAADFALCEQQSHMPYANTARVLRHLKATAQVAAE